MMNTHDMNIRSYVEDYLHPNALASFKFIGLRSYDFAPKQERQFISLELDDGGGLLTIATWLSTNKSDKGKIMNGKLEFERTRGTKWNICIEVR